MSKSNLDINLLKLPPNVIRILLGTLANTFVICLVVFQLFLIKISMGAIIFIGGSNAPPQLQC